MRWVIAACLVLLCENIFCQNVAINTTGATGDPSAILDLNSGNSGNRGFLPQQVVLTATNVAAPVASPAVGLIVYNTNTAVTSPATYSVFPGYFYWNGLIWVNLITNSKVTVPLPFLMLASATSGRYYCPGYNKPVDNFNDHPFSPPTTVYPNAAYESDNNYVISSNGYFSKVYGWLNAPTATKTVTVYVYLYSPLNNSIANISGVSLGSQTITIATANANYFYEVAANTAITKGQFIMVWFVTNSTMVLNASGTIECLYIPQ